MPNKQEELTNGRQLYQTACQPPKKEITWQDKNKAAAMMMGILEQMEMRELDAVDVIVILARLALPHRRVDLTFESLDPLVKLFQ